MSLGCLKSSHRVSNDTFSNIPRPQKERNDRMTWHDQEGDVLSVYKEFRSSRLKWLINTFTERFLKNEKKYTC